MVWKLIRRPKSRGLVSAPTFGDVRDTCAEGESGLIRILEEYNMLPRDGYNRSMGDIRLRNGSQIKLISGEKPARFRGPQFHYAWLDELATFNKPEAFDQARIIMRLPGEKPQMLVTTTPQNVPLITNLTNFQGNGTAPGVVISRGKTGDNLANLAEDYLEELELMYGGTRLWRQEILGELLEDVPGALWIAANILHEDAPLEWKRKLVAVDPAVTNTEDSDETGIIVAGQALDNRLGVIADYTTKDSIFGYAKRVLEAFRIHNCDLIVYEDNQGGTAVAEILHSIDPYAPVKAVKAYVGKKLRAEPIAALYEQCVVAGTLIFTERGQIPVEDVTTADRVWTRAGLKRVLKAGQTGVEPVMEVIAGQYRLECTAEHPVFTEGRGFVSAALLVPTKDRLVTWSIPAESGGRTALQNPTSANGATSNSCPAVYVPDSVHLSATPVTGIRSLHNGAKQPVYDLTVEDQPEFFANGVLVHNSKVFHVKQRDDSGHEVKHLAKLEDQMLSWSPVDKDSPDRLDAMVHGLTELAGTSKGSRFLLEIAEVCGRCQMPNEKGSTVCKSCGSGLNPSGKVPDIVTQWAGVPRG
jgi:phage terminase large subunit-like protein